MSFWNDLQRYYNYKFIRTTDKFFQQCALERKIKKRRRYANQFLDFKGSINNVKIIMNNTHTDDFKKEILNQINNNDGEYIDIRAKDIHKKIGGYPNSGNHRMPCCCHAMLSLKNENDIILPGSPSKLLGANLKIRYFKRK
ncbi:MAG TPA: hypothetical protein P5087_06315 [Eubacteriales bacterium]|nr:hypothetical protein [Eubacteriales bacterium]